MMKCFNNFRILLLCFLITACANNVFAKQAIPVITSVSPEYGAKNISTSTEVRVSFNTIMNKKSVGKSFNIVPKIDGRLYWEGSTLIFKPHKLLIPSTSYFVSFNPDVKAQDGIPLVVTYFSTPAQGVCVGPKGNISIVGIDTDFKQIDVRGYDPVWAADNQSIIYNYEGQIWKVETSGDKKEMLVGEDKSYKASGPAPNPFSEQTAFVGTNQAGCANIYTVETKTKIIRQLTGFYEPKSIDFLKWSPDGLYLAFLRAGQIWIMNQDGKNMRKLTNDDLECAGNFAWSPGGTKIAFTGQGNVWIGDIYSLEIEKRSFDNPKTGLLDWSANNKIVFESEGVTIMNADGSDEIRVPTAAKKPLWINSGEMFSLVLPLYNNKNTAQLWIMSVDGKRKEKIAVIDSEYTDVSWSRNLGFWNLFSP